jgi:hypothetical protein
MPQGVWIDGDGASTLDPLASPTIARQEVIDEFYQAVVHGQAVLHSGAWARATTAVSLAILASARTGEAVVPAFQVAPLQST